jgi:hypothetical protein
MLLDQETARVYLEGRLWPQGPKCPVCGLGERITTRNGGYCRCNQCKEDFTVRAGTIFERSHVPLHKWIYAMYPARHGAQGHLVDAPGQSESVSRKSLFGLSLGGSAKLAEAVSLSCTALLKLTRPTSAAKRPTSTSTRSSMWVVARPIGKTVVLGMRERGGRTKARPVDGTDAETLCAEIRESVEAGATSTPMGIAAISALATTTTRRLSIVLANMRATA